MMRWELKHLNFSYAKLWQINDLSLVLEGRVLGIIGKNGTGKSTFLRLLAGVEEPHGGEISFVSASGLKPYYLPSEDFLFDGFSLSWYLNWFSGLWKAKNSHALEIVSQLHLNPLLERPLYALSQGQRRLAHIALSLIKPVQAGLILDELFAHLDECSTQRVIEVLRLYIESGGSLVFASQSADLFQALAPELWYLGKNPFISRVEG